MKIRFTRMLSILCAVMMMISAVSAWADEDTPYSTPSDLAPEAGETAQEEPAGEEPAEPGEDPVPGEEPGQEPEEEQGNEPSEEQNEEKQEEQKSEPAEEKKDEPAKEEKAEPAKEQKDEPEKEQKDEPAEEPKEASAEEAADTEEVIITKALKLGQSWNGKMSKKKPAVLKLDLGRACRVHMVVEGKDTWATVQKADRLTDNPRRTESNPETGLMVVTWSAEAGSYLITLGPVEPNRMAMATVTFMDDGAFEAWEAAQATEEPEAEPEQEPETEPETEPESEPETEPETEPEQEPEAEPETEPEAEPTEEGEPEEDDQPEGEPEENEPESGNASERKITIELTWDVPEPVIGDTAHFKAVLEGYEGLEYTVQWQYSTDRETWYDIPDETSETMDIVITKTRNEYYWRFMVYLEEDPQEDEEV